MWRSTIFVLISILHLSTSASLCGTSNEIPFHNNVPPMETISPYTILTSISTTHQNEIVTLRIKSILSEVKFAGFTVHAFSTSQGEILGRFVSSRLGLKLDNCDSADNVATFQAYSRGENEVELQWEAPTDYVGGIIFNATVAKDFDTFWVGIASNPIQVVPNEVPILKTYLSSSPKSSDVISQLDVEPRNSALIYGGCGITKTCLGLPNNGCIETQSCEAVATASRINNRYEFELQSDIADVAYVALGLSNDGQMGGDSVMECIIDNGNVLLFTSYNNRRSNIRDGVPQNIVNMISGTLDNGRLYCKFERDAASTILGIEFNLPNENFHFLLAVGRTLSNTFLTRHDLRVASSTPLQILEGQPTDTIYQGCGLTKTCVGMPANCIPQQSCDAIVTATVIDRRFFFELQSSVDGVGYIALGLSSTPSMGDASVMECVQENGAVREYNSWNFPRSNTRNEVPQNITSMVNSSFVDGRLYCKLERDAFTQVLETEFDLHAVRFYFLIATGTTFTSSSLARHDRGRLFTSEPQEILRQQPVHPIYEGCGLTKTCVGMPANCIPQQSCDAIVTATILDRRFFFELQSSVDGVGYIALGLSSTPSMGDASVMECVQENGAVREYNSWNLPRSNTRNEVPQNITSMVNSSFVDGMLYCKLERDAFTQVLETEFDLHAVRFYFLIATGTTFTSSSLARHDRGRLSSSEPQEILRQQPVHPIYEGCGSTKTCVGLPLNCEQQQSCDAVVTAKMVNNRFFFELKSRADGVGYVALGLSRTPSMGEASVMECVQENGAVREYNSWNSPRDNTRVGVPQNITSLVTSSFVDGTLYCKLERDAFTLVLENEFDLHAVRFYFLIATGTTFTPQSLVRHDRGRVSSSEPQEIIRHIDPIYHDCGTTKTCFGMPDECLRNATCQAVVAVLVDDDRYEFELQSDVAGAAYVSFALSTDLIMGDDSVIECVQGNGVIRAFTSWNTPQPNLGNTRARLDQDIIEQLNSTYIDGKIYCKVRREKSSVVLDREFNLGREDFHFMLAIGSRFTANGIATHDLGRSVSAEPYKLPGRISGSSYVKMSAIAIVTWLIATSCTQFRGL